jgi:hypothetical protein
MINWRAARTGSGSVLTLEGLTTREIGEAP